MSDAFWLAGLLIANLWATGNLGVSSGLNNAEKGPLGGAAIGAQPSVFGDRTPVEIGPVLQFGLRATYEDAPDPQEIMRAMPRVDRGIPFIYETFRDDIEISTEKLVDRLDAPRFYPLIGPAQIHHRHWKCTVTFTETTSVAYPFPMQTQRKCKEVVYLDRDRLLLCGMPLENNAPFTVETSFEPVMRMVDDNLHPGRQMPCLAGRVWIFSNDGRTVQADGPLTIELYDQNPEAKGKPQLLAVWTYSPDILKTLWREDRRGEGYTLMLPCDPAAARLKKIKLDVKYAPKAARAASAESAVLNLLYEEGSSPAGQTESSEPSVPRIPVPFIEPFSYSPKNRLKIDAETLRQIAVEWASFWNHETPEPPACAPHRVAAPDILVLDVQKLTFKQGNPSSDPAQQIRGEHLVRPDGTVSLGMFGSVKVDGMTTAQVKNVIEHHLATYFVEPRVSVQVTTYNSRKANGATASSGAATQMTLTDVVRLSKRGISEDIIIRQLEITQTNLKLTVDDILSLSEQGVSDNVIRAIQMRLAPKSAPDRLQLFSY